MSDAKEVGRIVKAIMPLLAGKDGGIQGAVLAELVAIWQAGHHPDFRDTNLDLWLETVRALTPLCEMEIFGPQGFPMAEKLT
jgi:hypothetical protein